MLTWSGRHSMMSSTRSLRGAPSSTNASSAVRNGLSFRHRQTWYTWRHGGNWTHSTSSVWPPDLNSMTPSALIFALRKCSGRWLGDNSAWSLMMSASWKVNLHAVVADKSVVVLGEGERLEPKWTGALETTPLSSAKREKLKWYEFVK